MQGLDLSTECRARYGLEYCVLGNKYSLSGIGLSLKTGTTCGSVKMT